MYDNSNRLSLWLNNKREKQTHPHLKGEGETDVRVWASAWFSNDLPEEDKRALVEIIKRHNIASKRPFLTVSMQPKDFQGKPPQQSDQHNDHDDIPF